MEHASGTVHPIADAWVHARLQGIRPHQLLCKQAACRACGQAASSLGAAAARATPVPTRLPPAQPTSLPLLALFCIDFTLLSGWKGSGPHLLPPKCAKRPRRLPCRHCSGTRPPSQRAAAAAAGCCAWPAAWRAWRIVVAEVHIRQAATLAVQHAAAAAKAAGAHLAKAAAAGAAHAARRAAAAAGARGLAARQARLPSRPVTSCGASKQTVSRALQLSLSVDANGCCMLECWPAPPRTWPGCRPTRCGPPPSAARPPPTGTGS